VRWRNVTVWRACARAARRGGRPPLTVERISRARAQRHERDWVGPHAPTVRFGARSYLMLLHGLPAALLTAANPPARTVAPRLGLVRENCVELATLCGTTAPALAGGEGALHDLWQQHLVTSDWPFHCGVEKIALVCYPGRRVPTRILANAPGWQPAPTRRRRSALWVYWLGEPPRDAPIANASAQPSRPQLDQFAA
jgi:hypothetical protein